MYDYFDGKIEEVCVDYLVIDVGGIGYSIFCDLYTLSSVSKGEKAKIYTSVATTKDGAMTLYGFKDKDTRKMYELLTTVSGVGPKGALKILSKLKPDELTMAIVTDNEIAFKGAASPKIAGRIIVDLKKKVGSLDISSGMDMGEIGSVVSSGGGSVIKEATDALVGLGFSYQEAMGCVKNVMKDGMSVEDIIFWALKQGKN